MQFNADAVRRIVGVVKTVEGQSVAPAIPPRRHHKGSGSGSKTSGGSGRLCVITAAVTARTGMSPNYTMGYGSALFLTLDGLETSSTGETETVLNSTTSTIAVGSLCQVKVIEGEYVIDVVDCPSSYYS